MGLETIAFIALTSISAAQKMSAARSTAKQVVNNAALQNDALLKEGTLATKEKSKEIRQRAAALEASFLNSGVTLEGTPEQSISEILDTGKEDILNIAGNYNNKMNSITSSANATSKNTVRQGRTQAIDTITSSLGGSLTGGSIGSMFEVAGSYAPESFAYGLNSAGQGATAYKMLELKDARG